MIPEKVVAVPTPKPKPKEDAVNSKYAPTGVWEKLLPEKKSGGCIPAPAPQPSSSPEAELIRFLERVIGYGETDGVLPQTLVNRLELLAKDARLLLERR